MKNKKRAKFSNSRNVNIQKPLLKTGLKNKNINFRERLKEQIKASRFR